MSNDHDLHYDHDYKKWAEKAKANGREETSTLLEEVDEMSLTVKDGHQKAMGSIGDEKKKSGMPEVK